MGEAHRSGLCCWRRRRCGLGLGLGQSLLLEKGEALTGPKAPPWNCSVWNSRCFLLGMH